ncbi:uncharacterized protein LOC131929299 [Physella acuta]|uniref:uncharacterized protein LOC131929299 n=1 Tax=Physella acuta TaxID=109671 RepID=UPI0027DE85A4|nr:uncharacterized protein LOC131929299 [Physella acuta]
MAFTKSLAQVCVLLAAVCSLATSQQATDPSMFNSLLQSTPNTGTPGGMDLSSMMAGGQPGASNFGTPGFPGMPAGMPLNFPMPAAPPTRPASPMQGLLPLALMRGGSDMAQLLGMMMMMGGGGMGGAGGAGAGAGLMGNPLMMMGLLNNM